MKKDKFKIQDSEYYKPYHHLVSFGENYKQWESTCYGLEYYSYVSRVIKHIQKLSTFKNIAEVGCGDGKILLELAKIYPEKHFDGYDLSERAILFAKAYSYGYNNLDFFKNDFAKTSKRYDLIICVEVLEHIHKLEIKEFVSKIYDKLDVGGRLLVTVPSTNIRYVPKKHYRHYTLEILEKHLKNFEFVLIEYIHKNNFLFKVLNHIVENKLFIIKEKHINRIIKKLFVIFCIRANQSNGRHILIISKKNEK